MRSGQRKPESGDSWDVLRDDALRKRELSAASEKIQTILDRNPGRGGARAPETQENSVPVVMAPTPLPNPMEARKRLSEIFSDLPGAMKEAGEAATRLEKSNPNP